MLRIAAKQLGMVSPELPASTAYPSCVDRVRKEQCPPRVPVGWIGHALGPWAALFRVADQDEAGPEERVRGATGGTTLAEQLQLGAVQRLQLPPARLQRP